MSRRTKTPVDQPTANLSSPTPYLGIETDEAKNQIQARGVVVFDPVTGKALGASDFLSVFKQMPDAINTIPAPVSNTIYPVLSASNVIIESVDLYLTWAVTQPTNLRLIATVDGISSIWTMATPVTDADHFPQIAPGATALLQVLGVTLTELTRMGHQMLCGRSVVLQMAVTWAVTQPTNLTCRVKYATR